MVALLHDRRDESAHEDVAKLYQTRTLMTVHQVDDRNARAIVQRILADAITVVVPTRPERITDPVLTVLRVLQLLGVTTTDTATYLQEINQPAGATAAPARTLLAPVGEPIR